MRQITEIILHTTATAQGWMAGKDIDAKVAEVRRWHMQDRGWRDIGYHFLIDRDGEIAKGRPIEQTGAHVKGRNTGTIGIALVGGHGGKRTDAFRENYTKDQEAALVKLIKWLHANYGVVPVTGHNQYANKECPCFDAPKWWAAVSAPATPEKIAAGAGVGVLGAYAAANSQWWLVGLLCAVVVGAFIWKRMKR